MNLNGCRNCKYYVIDNACEIICSFNGKISYRDIYEGARSRAFVLRCPRSMSSVLV